MEVFSLPSLHLGQEEEPLSGYHAYQVRYKSLNEPEHTELGWVLVKRRNVRTKFLWLAGEPDKRSSTLASKHCVERFASRSNRSMNAKCNVQGLSLTQDRTITIVRGVLS